MEQEVAPPDIAPPGITLDEAWRLIMACVAEAKRIGVTVAIAVTDDRGDIMAAARMDGTPWGWTPDVARGKALAAALWRQPGSVLEKRNDEPVPQMLSRLYSERLVYRQGSELLVRNGRMVGAIGVSGAHPQQDEDVAKAGVAAFESAKS